MNRHQPRKRFGQNFLHDPRVIGRIVETIQPAADDHMVEIGPGQGALTEPLSRRVRRLDLLEIDRDLAGTLASRNWPTAVQVHCVDALQIELESLATGPGTLRLVGNLPYNISTPLLFHLLDQHRWWHDAHVMLQKEVVQRMAATPGSRTYGRLSVALAARCSVAELFTIKPGAFQPAPQVLSAIARLQPLSQPLIQPGESETFNAVLRAAFGQRRKQLANSLRPLLTADAIRACNIDPAVRPEQLDVHAFIALTAAVNNKRE